MHEAIPETVSVPVKVTITSVLFQLLALGSGDFVALAVGFVRSVLIVTVVEPEFPARSVHVLVPVCDPLSPLTLPTDQQHP